MTHHNDSSTDSADRLGRVLECLTFSDRGALCVELQCVSTESRCGRGERKAGASGRLEEEVGNREVMHHSFRDQPIVEGSAIGTSHLDQTFETPRGVCPLWRGSSSRGITVHDPYARFIIEPGDPNIDPLSIGSWDIPSDIVGPYR